MKPTNDYSIAPNNQPIIVQLALLLFLIIVCAGVGSGLVQLLGTTMNMDYAVLAANLKTSSPIAEKNFIRLGLSIGHSMSFIVPSLFFMWLLHQKDWQKLLQITKLPTITNSLVAAFFILSFFPIAQWTYWLNQQIPLPSWALKQENLINETMISLLKIEQPYELLFNILVIGVLPAIGEELLFRGILQRKLATFWQQEHLAVWVSAFIFSAIHFQFQGFLPRLLLGAALGYLLVWTRNLWVPIIAHFVFNTSQVIFQYVYYNDKTEHLDLGKTDNFPIWTVLISLGFLALLRYVLKKERLSKK